MSTAVEVLCRFALLLAGPQSAAPHPTARVDALFAHLDRAIPESGFPNGSRRFLLTDQSADRNDGDERLRLWLPPSGSLLSEPLDAAGAIRLTAAVGCEFHDSVWPPEGSDLPRPAGARMRHDFAIEWVPAAAGASVVALAACRVDFDPESAVDGRVRVDVDVAWPAAAQGEGRIRFRVARSDGPPGDLSILPTLWGPRVVHAAAPPAARPDPPRLREEVVADLLDPRFAPGRKGAERVELGTRSAASGGAGNGAPAPTPEAVARPGIVVEAHFETGHGIELPNGGARPALAFAGRGEARFELPADACANGARLVFEPGFFDWSGVPTDALADARARWRVELDGRELVAGDLAAPRRAVDRGWGEPVDVALVAKDGATAHELVLTVEVSDYSAPVEAVVSSEPLSEGGTREQRLRLERPWFGLARPRLVRARPVARAAASAAAPNVLWICVETFRADEVGFGRADEVGFGRADEVGFGSGARATTPFLARLAPRALVFSQATSPAPWTLPSVASYFTGLHPFEHGARSELEDVLPDRLPKLAEVAAISAGARTFAGVTNDLIRRDAGFAAGFDVFAPFAYANAAAVRRLFLDWQSEAPSERFFAYLHWFDPHAPLNAPGWMRDAFVPPGLRDLPYSKEESAPKRAMRQTGDARNSGDALEYLRGRYRGEVRFVDLQVELLFAELARRGLLDRTLVIVTGDHGEEFGEHRWFGHGSQLYEESIHVPLLLHGPGVPAGRIDVPVESLLASRIAAAALGVAGFGSDALPAPEWPLSRERLEEQWAGQPVVSTTEKLIDVQSPGWPADGDGFVARVTPRAGRMLRVGDKKSILARPVGRGRAPPAAGDALELFDLARDPGELAPERVAWDESAVGRFARFAAWLATERRLDAALPTLETEPDVREVLRRLGYTQGGTGDR